MGQRATILPCVTLLPNAGAPVLAAQAILCHKHIDTMLGHAGLYDGTIAADYDGAMGEIESRFQYSENASAAPDYCQTLALVDALGAEALSDAQRKTLHALRSGIPATFGSPSGSLADTGDSAGLDEA